MWREVNNRMTLRSALEVYVDMQNKRLEMIELAQIYGMNSEETVRSSQELDVLMNEYFAIKARVKKQESDNEVHVIQESLEYNTK
jgi:hypothetical protein